MYGKKENASLSDLRGDFRVLKDNSKKALEKPFIEQEIWNSIINCDSSRAPGPGGFSMGFFKKQWKTLKGEIMKIVKDFYHTASLDSKVSTLFITLIPKCSSLTSINDCKPISLISSLYKIIAKTLANKLKLVINEVIGEN